MIKKYKIRENFFETIDTEEKAYILGLFAADGSVCGNRCVLALSGEDGKMIELVRDAIYLEKRPIYTYFYDNKNHSPSHRLTITNKIISSDLKSHGIVENKTYNLVEPSTVPSRFLSHYIRGYFDGDGHIGYWFIKQSKKEEKGLGGLKANFNIVSTTIFCNWLKSIFSSIGVNSHIVKNRGSGSTIVVSGNRQIQIVCDFIYKDANIFLKRKFDKYLYIKNYRLINHRKVNKYGQFTIV